MPSSLLDHLLRGQFNFLRPDPVEIHRVMPSIDERLPAPERIFLDDEDEEPLVGFPILMSRGLRSLDAMAGEYLQAEEAFQLAGHTREGFDTRAYGARWERYRNVFAQLLHNAVGSSFGAKYPDILFLHHSLFIAAYLRGIPKRMVRQDLTVGRDFGSDIKYQVFTKWANRVADLTAEVVHTLAATHGDDPEALDPKLFELMRDNVLIFTEEHISPDLSELSAFLNGYLKVDGRDLRQRLETLKEWHEKNLRNDAVLRSARRHLAEGQPGDPTTRLLTHPGYLSYLASHITYSASSFPSAKQIETWEKLLPRLKQFEILHALRKMIVQIQVEDGSYVCRDRSTNMTWVGGPPVLNLSPATRPIDFTSTWVVDPTVQRFGLVYDISDFSATITMLGRREKSAIENAFRTTFSLQRKINNLADAHRLRLEKYLGDGAFFSGRHAASLLIVAIHLQRFYSQALADGFPFNRGLRIALNFGEYRLLPLEGGPGEQTARYEFFGHGLVELARLTTGKKTQEIEELKNYLVTRGYKEKEVATFFEPLTRKSSDLVNKDEENRRFFAYINPNGTLINEGIVATENYLKRLDPFDQLHYAKDGRRGYIVVSLEQPSGEPLVTGVRKLGTGKFKGLDEMPIYEIVDGALWQPEDLQEIPVKDLSRALEKVFAATFTHRSLRKKTGPRPAVTKK